MSGIRIEQRHTLGDWSTRWDELVAAATKPSPFLRSWWIDNMACEQRIIIGVLIADELVGGIALDRRQVLGGPLFAMIGSGPLAPDHVDAVAHPAHGSVVVDTLRSWIRTQSGAVFDLQGLPAHSLAAAIVQGVGTSYQHAVAPFARLPQDATRYLASLPGQTRSTITRCSKRLAKAGYAMRVVSPVDASDALERLANLHDSRWGQGSAVSGNWDLLRPALLEGARLGDVMIHELATAEGQVIASELDFVVGSQMSFYQAGRLTDRDYRGSGSVLRYAIIAAAIDRKVTEFDLLRGDEPYKAEWANASRPLMRLRRGVGLRGAAIATALNTNYLLAAKGPAVASKFRRAFNPCGHLADMTRVSTPDCVADSAHLSPMWLRHHHVDQLDRCCRIANHQVCRRCVVLYPLTVICALLYLAGWWLPPASDPWLLWLLPAPMVAEWAAGMWGAAFRPRRQILATALGAVASGVALAVHSQTPFAARVAWPVTVYVCLGFAIAAVAGWKAHRVSARSRLTADADEAFERSEAARTQRLVHMLESVRPD